MRWRELTRPLRMERVAIVAPAGRLRSVLLAVADAGVVELEVLSDARPARQPRRCSALARPGRTLPAPRILAVEPQEPEAYVASGRIDSAGGRGRTGADSSLGCP